MDRRLGGLWRNHDFLRLWTGQTVSLFGSQVTRLALPLTAVLVLNADAADMSLLGAAQYLPYLVFGLLAGAWVDRLQHRPLLIAADVGRAVLIGSIPPMWLIGSLSMAYLIVLSLFFGTLTVFFDIAYQAFLPVLVGRDHLLEGNSKLAASESLGRLAGPSLGGMLIQLASAPLAIVADALSFLGSALFLWRIKLREPPLSTSRQRDVFREIGDGIRFVRHEPLLRSLAIASGLLNLFDSALSVLYVLYVTRNLGVEPAMLGGIFAVGTLGGLVGAMVGARTANRFGLGRTLVSALALVALGRLLIVAAQGPTIAIFALLGLSQMLTGLGSVAYNINQVSLRQALTPEHLQGRMSGTMRFVTWGVLPVGSLLGGALGTSLGLWAALAIAAMGMLLAAAVALLSPLSRVTNATVSAAFRDADPMAERVEDDKVER